MWSKFREWLLLAFRYVPVVAVAALLSRPVPVSAQTFGPPIRVEKEADAFAPVEEKAVARLVERQSRQGDTDRGRWLLELDRIYPGRCAAGHTKADFDQWFALLADGKPEWRKDAAANRAVCELFDRVTQKLDLGPVPSLKKEEFTQFATAVLRPDKNGAIRVQEQYAEADKMFRILDRDGNGVIEGPELTDRMRAVVAAEPDGPTGFDRDRYRIYFQGRVATAVELMTLPQRTAATGDTTKSATGKSKKKPAGIPPWFDLLDTDGDGQISLAEWRTDLLPADLFQAMDLNADGLVTPAEYLRFVKQNPDKVPVELKLSAAAKK
jgi:Ca2+-binding EF-hand superfamily protein